MTDVLFIEGLRLNTRIGISERERSKPQEVVVDVTMHVDLMAAAVSDSIDDALDYGAVIRDIQGELEPLERKTVERLALDIARIVLRRKRCARVDVRITKPTAHPGARGVGCAWTRTPAEVFTPTLIGMGSNHDAAAQLEAALRALSSVGRVDRISRVYRSDAVGGGPMPYVNLAALVWTEHELPTMRAKLKELEARLGRDPARTDLVPIDLDLCAYGDRSWQDGEFVLPDPDIATRAYLARSLADIAPERRLPGDPRTLRERAAAFAATVDAVIDRTLHARLEAVLHAS
ncbi:MAG: 2-amino-4-hydroxy-6-hydroxymethyldihydropteridine diphosphokinase [Planctomycetes bacterium]|nr:2-amino-4-hydroxy-6-hydroxymethyldihydropteridine diphosphokinase [Planctomycetota bacterium]MCC7173040.1 2-amino-4-hydroxy-6-hydroxymethyldihydropteridine diphosphokinase [Planctomycetota bacterium]